MFLTMDALTGLVTILQVSLFCISLQIDIFSPFERIWGSWILWSVQSVLYAETLAAGIHIFILV